MTMETNDTHLQYRNFLLHPPERVGYEQPVLLKEPARKQPSAAHLKQFHNE